MKTLVISEVFPPRTGGSGRWLWELYRRWPRGSVVILAGQHPEAEAFDQTHDVQIQRMPLSFESWGLVGYQAVRRYTAAYRRVATVVRHQDVTQTHCGRMLPEGLIAWMIHMRHRVPYACYVHGEELNTASTSRELSFLATRVLLGARVLIANSANTAHVLMNQWKIPAAQIEIVNPGVDASTFVVADRDATARERLGWGDRRVILTVGRLQTRKGHARLIAAMEQIIQRVPDALYAIVGDGEMRAELSALTKARKIENHVQFLGELGDAELRTCFQQCDLFALPNVPVQGDFEGFGMVLVEAQACGKPVLAGRSGGTKETMREGETGRLVNCENESELAKNVSDLLTDDLLRHRMGTAGRRWVERRFDWSVLAAKTQAVLADRFGSSLRAAA